MTKFLESFRKDECGAVTVDWVVLTAAMTGFGVLIALGISNAATDPAEGMGAALQSMDVGV